jgi:hypothetical protein
LRSVFAHFAAACVVAIGIAGPLAERGAAFPLTGLQSAERGTREAFVRKVHGFHCRSVLGWDPVAGVYRRHRHRGICRDYRRCLHEQKRCIFVLGRGFERWSYETFGSENARFTACMIRSGCY